MNDILKVQLQKCSNLEFKVDGKVSTAIPEDFEEIVFMKQMSKDEKPVLDTKFEFVDWFIHPSPSFDFHKQWNGNNPPPSKVMFGKILKETEKMLLVDLYDSMSNNWTGWIIKKCVTITN